MKEGDIITDSKGDRYKLTKQGLVYLPTTEELRKARTDEALDRMLGKRP